MKERKWITLFGVTAAFLIFVACVGDSGNNGTETDGTSSSLEVSSSSVASSSSAVAVSYGEMTDPRDKQVYKTVVIGTQMWMAENLNYDTLDGMGSWCYENSADSCTKFGRLYQWVVAMVLDSVYNDTIWSGSGVNRQGICPSGWHLPSNDEWQTLAAYVSAQSGVGGKDVDGSWSAIGTLLKSTTEWPSYSGVATGTNTFGFSALPGGYRLDGGDFVGVDRGTFFWSSTESSYYYYAYNRTLTYYSEYFNNIDNFKKHAFSVRCVKDL